MKIVIERVPYYGTDATLEEAIARLREVLRDHGAPMPEWLDSTVSGGS